MCSQTIGAIALSLVIAISAGSAAEVRYTVTGLGILPGGTASQAYGLNAQGQVTGVVYMSGGSRGFLYSDGVMTDLGSIAGFSGSVVGSDINANGQITGTAYVKGNAGDAHAFLYSNGTMTDLGTLPGASYSSGTGINDSGQICGTAKNSDGQYRSFICSNGTMVDLGTLPGHSSSYANDLNANGQVTGYSSGSEGRLGFLCTSGNMVELGGLSPVRSITTGIAVNASGQVTGESLAIDGYNHAFLFSNGSMTDLGTLPSFTRSTASDINDDGDVVGYALGNGLRAFIYSNGLLTDLNLLVDPGAGWTLERATAINNLGQITGYGRNAQGLERAFLLTPVPEPAALSLVGLAGLLLLSRRKPRRLSFAGMARRRSTVAPQQHGGHDHDRRYEELEHF